MRIARHPLSKAGRSHQRSTPSGSHITVFLATPREGERVEGLIPWLRVRDLEPWLRSLRGTPGKPAAHSSNIRGRPFGSPPPPQSSRLRGCEMNQKFMFSSQGLPEAPACARDSPVASHRPSMGWPTRGSHPAGAACRGSWSGAARVLHLNLGSGVRRLPPTWVWPLSSGVGLKRLFASSGCVCHRRPPCEVSAGLTRPQSMDGS